MDKNTFFGWLQEKALIIEANHLASGAAGALVLHGVITNDSKTKTAQWIAGSLIWLGSYLIGKLNHKAAQDAPPASEVPIAQSPKVAAARTSLVAFALALTLAPAYAQTNTSPATFPRVIFNWFTSFNTNLTFQPVQLWSGPVQDGSQFLNESGMSIDLVRQSTNNDGGFYFAVENRDRTGAVPGTLVSTALGIQGGWMHYDLRLGIYADGVYFPEAPTSAGLLINKNDFGGEVGFTGSKMISSTAALGVNIGYQFAPKGKGGLVVGPQMNVQFGNGTGLFGL